MFKSFVILFLSPATFLAAQAQDYPRDLNFSLPESEKFETNIPVNSWNLECSSQTDLDLSLDSRFPPQGHNISGVFTAKNSCKSLNSVLRNSAENGGTLVAEVNIHYIKIFKEVHVPYECKGYACYFDQAFLIKITEINLDGIVLKKKEEFEI